MDFKINIDHTKPTGEFNTELKLTPGVAENLLIELKPLCEIEMMQGEDFVEDGMRVLRFNLPDDKGQILKRALLQVFSDYTWSKS